jgi:HEAT repeat protein
VDKLVVTLRMLAWKENYRKMVNGVIDAIGATRSILDQFTALLGSADARYQAAGMREVGAMGDSAAIPTILDRLSEFIDVPDLRDSAVSALAKIGPAAATPAILDGLARLLADISYRFDFPRLSEVAQSLGAAMGTPAILDQIGKLLEQKDLYELREAIESVQGIGPAAAGPAILDRLALVLDDQRLTISVLDPHKSMRDCALEAVRAIGPGAATPAILDRLARILDEPGSKMDGPTFHADHSDERNKGVRELAIEALGSMGAAAAIPSILSRFDRLLGDWDVHIRRSVSAAAERMGTAAARSDFAKRVGDVYSRPEDPFMEYQFMLRTVMSFGLRFFAGADGRWVGRHVDELSREG